MEAPDTFRIRARFGSFESFAEATAKWDFDFTILGKSGFDAELVQFVDMVADYQFGRGRFRSHLRQLGAPPVELRTFAIPASSSVGFDWRGHEVSANDIAIFPKGGELHSFSKPNFDVFTVSSRESEILSVADALGFPEMGAILRQTELVKANPRDADRLRRMLLAFEVSACSGVDRRLLQRTWHAALAQLVQTIGAGSAARQPVASSRERVVRLAESYVLEHAREVPTVRDLCQVAGVSSRTLQYGFKEIVGVTPEDFIKGIRLHGSRKDLLEAPPTRGRIADIANSWGFWHMGQFAKDYRAMFGELPSQTRPRSRGRSLVAQF